MHENGLELKMQLVIVSVSVINLSLLGWVIIMMYSECVCQHMCELFAISVLGKCVFQSQ